MDDNPPKENPPADFNKLDLSQLQGFSFGTQWTQEKPSAPDSRDRRDEGDDRPRREDRRDGGGQRDRRGFRRPMGQPAEGAGAPRPAGAPAGREGAFERYPRREGGGGGEYRGGPRRDSGDRGPRQGYGRGAPMERGPYDSPYYSVMFYPEDSSFNTLVQTIRKSCRTVELFEIARTVVAKTDRFVVVVSHKPSASAAPGKPGEAPASAETPAAGKAARPLLHISVPDGIPFESDEAAVAHVMSKHLDKFFEAAEVEVDPPKGNFQVINKCGVTGELLGPPNYHRYNQIVQQHYAAKISRMPFDLYKNRIETIRDPEVVNQWLAKMKKTTRYTWKFGAKPAKTTPTGEAKPADAATPAETPAAEEPKPVESPSPAAETPAAEAPASSAPAEGKPAEAPAEKPAEAPAAEAAEAKPEKPAAPTFDNLEDARMYLLTHARDKVVRTTENARFHGKVAETMPPGEIRRAIEGALERQRRFPLDTANALRGRLRREHFTIFKKGSKGVSYVCAVKRKFRIPGQTFADSIGSLISYIEANPMIRASELAPKFLGIEAAAMPKAAEAPAPAPAEPAGEAAAGAAPAKAEPALSFDERAKISRMQGDLMWLVREGYVTEFIDGRLFAPPPMVEARKKEIEGEEHDPENFPEAPPAAAAEPASAEPAPATESAAPAEAPAAEPPAATDPGEPPADETKPA
jgi:hypothetical protein